MRQERQQASKQSRAQQSFSECTKTQKLSHKQHWCAKPPATCYFITVPKINTYLLLLFMCGFTACQWWSSIWPAFLVKLVLLEWTDMTDSLRNESESSDTWLGHMVSVNIKVLIILLQMHTKWHRIIKVMFGAVTLFHCLNQTKTKTFNEAIISS